MKEERYHMLLRIPILPPYCDMQLQEQKLGPSITYSYPLQIHHNPIHSRIQKHASTILPTRVRQRTSHELAQYHV